LRTPLNAILGYSDLMLLGVPSEIGPETRHQVDRIRNAARHLLQMVDDVLNFARIETGKDRVRVGAVNLDMLIRDAVGMVSPAATEKGLMLGYQAITGVVLHTDEGKVMQILNNLLSNAVKFTNDGRIDVHARVDDDCAVVDVADSGIGIPQQHLERIFDPFWQVEPAPTRRYGGTGIGLGVARNLTRLLGGDLTVNSTEGVGSVFTVRLPLRYEAIPPEI
jgi:signal transduction histidine kinase